MQRGTRTQTVEQDGRQSSRPLRDRLRAERGQAIVLMVLSLTVLLGMAALVLDLGLGWYGKRQLQATADAAAMAGAQDLPSSANATARANEYVNRNPVKAMGNVNPNVSVFCDTTIGPICNPYNAVSVRMNATAPTSFSKIFGIDSMDINASATACQPCGAKPLDIMIALDRTGSMNTAGKMTSARNAIKSFLGFFDPGITRVGLVVWPPAKNGSSICSTPQQGSNASTYNTYKYFNYDDPNALWTVVPLNIAQDWKVNGTLNNSSALLSTLNCLTPAGNTHYTKAMSDSQAEIAAHGRPDVQKVVVFLTDGEANVGTIYDQASMNQPCQTAINAANAVKAAGTLVYTIGYDVSGSTLKCKKDARKTQAAGGTPWVSSNGTDEVPSKTPTATLTAMASPGNYYNKPGTGQITTIFMQIAADMSTGVSRLVR